MSTTVSYKGQTLTTVSNDTKTLLTEGKYLEDDITLEDVSGGGAVLGTKNITANGTYEAEDDSLDGYSEVTVAVPNSYSAGDEGKVVSNGALVAQTAHADVTPTTSDQTIDTTTNDSIKVKGDADLVASNIKKDVEIFGVTGSYEGGGGTLPRLLDHVEYTLVSDATQSNKQNIQLTAVSTNNFVLFLTPKTYPSAPSTGYTALNWIRLAVGGANPDQKGSILRADGTVGTDANMASYNSNTGVLQIGGQYGTFRTGQVFDIYLFELA